MNRSLYSIDLHKAAFPDPMEEVHLKFTKQRVWGILSHGYTVSTVVFQGTQTHTGVPQVNPRNEVNKSTSEYWFKSLLRQTYARDQISVKEPPLTTGGDVLRRPYRDVTQGQCD